MDLRENSPPVSIVGQTRLPPALLHKADKLSEKGYLDIIPKRQVVQVRHLVYDSATSQPHLGARLAIFDLYKLFIFNKIDNVAHELLDV